VRSHPRFRITKVAAEKAPCLPFDTLRASGLGCLRISARGEPVEPLTEQGFFNSRHRSMKCSCAVGRSAPLDAAHFCTKAEGIIICDIDKAQGYQVIARAPPRLFIHRHEPRPLSATIWGCVRWLPVEFSHIHPYGTIRGHEALGGPEASRRQVKGLGGDRTNALATPRGFEPPISSVTSWYVRPLHHGAARAMDSRSSIQAPF
jgi:hypothetical protein